MTNLRAYAKEREVTGAAAEVADEDEFVAIEGGFMGVGSGDGLEFKIDMLEAGDGKSFAKTRDGELIVVLIVGADEAHGTADDGGVNRLAELLFSGFAQVFEHAGDEIFKLVAAAEDLSTGEGAAGEMGLERLDETAFFVGLEIALDGVGAGEGVDAAGCACGFRLFKIEDGAERWRLNRAEREGDELHRAVGGHNRDGAIGGSKVDADRGSRILKILH